MPLDDVILALLVSVAEAAEVVERDIDTAASSRRSLRARIVMRSRRSISCGDRSSMYIGGGGGGSGSSRIGSDCGEVTASRYVGGSWPVL